MTSHTKQFSIPSFNLTFILSLSLTSFILFIRLFFLLVTTLYPAFKSFKGLNASIYETRLKNLPLFLLTKLEKLSNSLFSNKSSFNFLLVIKETGLYIASFFSNLVKWFP